MQPDVKGRGQNPTSVRLLRLMARLVAGFPSMHFPTVPKAAIGVGTEQL